MDQVKFDFQVHENRRGTVIEGIEAGRTDPEGALNLLIRIARDHLVLSIWPVRPQVAGLAKDLAKLLGSPRQAPAVCGFGDCMDDDKDAPMETTMWEFDPPDRPQVVSKIYSFLNLPRD